MESRHEYNKLKKCMESSHDSKQSNFGVKLPHDSTTTNSKAQKLWHDNKPSLQNEQLCETSRTKTNYSNNYSLRSKHEKASEHIPNTEYDVTQDKIVSNHTINKAHLTISLSPAQQHLQNLHLSTPNKISKSTETPNSQASPSIPKFLMSNLLSPFKSPSTETQQHPKDKEVNDMINGVFNTKLIAAMTNRDSVLREVRDCILADDEKRCKKLCKQIHGQWRNLSTHNGCILADNKLATISGPIIDGPGREIYFLACIDRFSKFPTLKLYNNANGPNIEKFLNKYIVGHGVPRNLRIDQARCLKGNKV